MDEWKDRKGQHKEGCKEDRKAVSEGLKNHMPVRIKDVLILKIEGRDFLKKTPLQIHNSLFVRYFSQCIVG